MTQLTCFKASETLLGIETLLNPANDSMLDCFKASETLLGIETIRLATKLVYGFCASKPLKPF